MNANELADELMKFYNLEENIAPIQIYDLAATMLRQQQAEIEALRSVVYWLKENRPEVWDDIKKWSKI